MRALVAFVAILVAAVALGEAGYRVLANTVLALVLLLLVVVTLVRVVRARSGLAATRCLGLLAASVAFAVAAVAAFGASMLWLGVPLAAASGYLSGQVATRLRRHERDTAAARGPA